MAEAEDEKGRIAREEVARVAACNELPWFDLGRGPGKDEFLRCRLLTPGTDGPWLIATVVERRGYSTKAKAEATNETVVIDAVTRALVFSPADPRATSQLRVERRYASHAPLTEGGS